MKKILSVSILFLYTISGVGFVIVTHFCAGEISSISLKTGENPKKNCGCDEDDDSCCEDEYKIIKVSDDQKQIASGNLFVEKKFNNWFVEWEKIEFFQTKNSFVKNITPKIRSRSLEIQNSVLLI